VSTGKSQNTIAARYARLRAKAEEEAREAGQWPQRKGNPKSAGPTILTMPERFARLKAKFDHERLHTAGRQWIMALLLATGKRRRQRRQPQI
jgi:hypothetical protein